MSANITFYLKLRDTTEERQTCTLSRFDSKNNMAFKTLQAIGLDLFWHCKDQTASHPYTLAMT